MYSQALKQYGSPALLKPVTVYLYDIMYVKYQMQAKRRGVKASSLIREAMDSYAQENFGEKLPLDSLSFDRTVHLKSGAGDFLNSDYKSEFLDSGAKF